MEQKKSLIALLTCSKSQVRVLSGWLDISLSVPAAPRGAPGLVSYLLELVAGKTLAAENQEKGLACANSLEAFFALYPSVTVQRNSVEKN